jgi:CRP-like cAMP-binding protein
MTKERFDKWYEILTEIGIEKEYKTNTSLVLVGKKTNKIYFVKSGGIVLLFEHPYTGQERAVNFFTPTFHSMATVSSAFYHETPSKYHLQTFTKTTILEIDKLDFNRFIYSSEIGNEIMHYGLSVLLEKNELRALLLTLNSKEMFKYLHENMPQILQQVPSKFIADYLGVSPQWLSKLKHSL